MNTEFADTELVDGAMRRLSQEVESGIAHVDAEFLWLAMCLRARALQVRGVETEIQFGALLAAVLPGFGGLGLAAVFWDSLYAALPLTSVLAVAALGGLTFVAGAAAWRLRSTSQLDIDLTGVG